MIDLKKPISDWGLFQHILPRRYLQCNFLKRSSLANEYPKLVAPIRFHQRALRAALKIAMIIVKIFDHLQSLDEIVLITVSLPLLLLPLSLLLCHSAIRPYSIFFQPGQKWKWNITGHVASSILLSIKYNLKV